MTVHHRTFIVQGPTQMSVDTARIRCHHQRLTGARPASALQVVEWFGAIQAQDFGAALWAVGQRSAGLTAEDVTRAIADKEIVRSWPMRGTIHFVPAADLRWMLSLTGARENDRVLSLLRGLGHGQTTLDRARKILEAALSNGPLTRPEIYAKLEEEGISTAKTVGIQILTYWAQSGLICFATHRGKQPTFVLLDDWLSPARSNLPDRDVALRTLAERYFRSHGLATERDFAWWAGITLTVAREAIRLAGDLLSERVLDGVPFLSHVGSQPEREPDGDVLRLLSPFDEILVGYKDRSAYDLAGGASDKALTLFGPTILLNGRLAGAWQKTLGAKSGRVTLAFGPEVDARGRALVDAEIAHLSRFWGMPIAVS
jgi:hypothetical protein